MAVLDTAHRDLYVACTGDSRAVAGFWEETEDGRGSWRVEVLSEDQTGRNLNELKRFEGMVCVHLNREADRSFSEFSLNILLMKRTLLSETDVS
jgi:hypothetical protein